MTAERRVALIADGGRDLGRAAARALTRHGMTVIAGHGEEMPARPDCDAATVALDVTDPASVSAALASVRDRFGRLDVLVNDAEVRLEGAALGANPATARRLSSPLEVPADLVRRTLEVNLYGAIRLIQAAVPLMREGGYGRIVNVGSRRGQFADPDACGMPGYRMSKSALNTVTLMFAKELAGTNILVNAIDAAEPSDLDADAELLARLAALADVGPSGAFFRGGAVIPW